MSTPRQISKILNLANLETNTITASIDSDIVNQTVTLGVTLPVGTISVSSADTLPLSNIQIGQQGFVTSTNRLYIYNGSGWYNIATINSTPYWVTEANASYTLNTDGTATVVEINAADSDGTIVSYTATGDSNFNAIATVVQDSDGRFVIRSIDSDGSASPTAGSGILTFTATDGVDQASTASTFSISFSPNWTGSYLEIKKVSSDLAAGDNFGTSVSITPDGTYAIVGAQMPFASGAAYIFTRSGSTWTQQAKLVSSDLQASDDFGWAVSISSDASYAVVTAKEEDGGSGDPIDRAGAAYIFTRSGSTWTQQAKLTASDAQVNDQFGYSVSMNSDGSYVSIGAYFEDGGAGDPASAAGAVYVFTRSGSTWTQQTILRASDAEAGDVFGYSVSMNSDASYAIVGAANEDTGGSNTGAAYIFTRSGSTWTQQQKIQSSGVLAGDNFGRSVSINSDATYAIIGASFEDTGGVSTGSAYIFTRSGSTWTQQQKLQSSPVEANARFGEAVSISSDGTHAIIGAIGADGAGSDDGAAFIFSRSGSTWTEQQKLYGSDGDNYAGAGHSVSISGNGKYAIVASRSQDLGDGAAYFFEAG